MSRKSILGALIRCEITASYDWLGNIRVSAKGAVAIIVFALLLVTLKLGDDMAWLAKRKCGNAALKQAACPRDGKK